MDRQRQGNPTGGAQSQAPPYAARRERQPNSTPTAQGDRDSRAEGRSVENLEVFKLAHDLALRIYEATGHFPREEALGLGLELRRAAVSVPTKLAEGFARSRSDYRQLVDVAKGSADETSYRLTLARDLGYLQGALHDSLREDYIRVAKMLTRLGQALSRQDRPEHPHARD